MKKITLLSLLFSFCAFTGFGQTLVDDFESGAGGLVSNAGGITTSVVANPNPSGINTTANCMEIRRTGSQWWIIGGVNVTPDLAISDTETKYVSMMVYYPAQPDLGIRFDAPDDNSNGGGSSIVRSLNTYTTPNQWQEIVWEIKDNPTATAFTHGTLFRLSIHPDMGFENDPAGQVLDNTSAFGYIDQIQILDSNPLSTDKFSLDNAISLYPNPVNSVVKINAENNVRITSVSFYNLLGKVVANDAIGIGHNEYDISNLSSGMYMVKIADDRGGVATKRLIKR